MRIQLSKLTASVILAVAATSGNADVIIDSSLQAELGVAAQGSWLPVFVELPNQFDTPALQARLQAESADFARSHREIMLALQAFSEREQAPFMAALKAAEAAGELAAVKPLWITNGLEMQATASGVQRLAEIFDDAVLHYDVIELIEPVEQLDAGPHTEASPTHEWGLDQIGASTLWEMGIFGQGTMVANLDTGVDGGHEALARKWHGLDEGVGWWEAWYAEDSSDFPSDSDTHGTHTMGTMCGSVERDTIGVAPAAHWIAARVALSGNPGVGINSAFQWCSDPDSDPATTDDVPDAVNNSWGGGTNCSSYHFSSIDNMEAMGAIAVFAAGNEGPGAQTIGNPGNRADTHVNCLAVGATNDTEGLANFSSRGPTRCNVPDSLKFKPDVAAPGVNVRSSIPGDRYTRYMGTSMACPHVAGAIALLRQIMPTLPPQELKTLLFRTARNPENPGGDDNRFGRGIIDLEAAANYLFNEFNLDGHIEGDVTDLSSGDPLPEALVEILEASISTHPDGSGVYSFHTLAGSFTVVTSLFGYYPDTTVVVLEGGGTSEHDVALRSLPYGSISGTLSNNSGAGIAATISIYDESNDSLVVVAETESDGSFNADVRIGSYRVVVHPAPPEMFYTVTAVEVDSAGVADLSTQVEPADILFVDADGGETNYESYILDAIEELERSYNMWDRAAAGAAETAIAAMPSESKVFWASGDATEGIMTEGEQAELATWLNHSGRLYLGGQNIIESITGGTLSTLLGITYDGLSGEHSITAVEGSPLGEKLGSPIFTTGTELPLNQTSQDLLSGGNPAALYGGEEGSVALVTWSSGNAVTVVSGFGPEGIHGELPGAMSRTEFLSIIFSYLEDPNGVEDDGGRSPAAVARLELTQNSPNPFNPSTMIRFSLPREAEVKLGVYDTRGNLVTVLAQGQKAAGRYAVRWDGRNTQGQAVASGVYFYRLDTGDKSLIRSMILVK
jgi:subtilisin family serine protease